MTSQVLTITNNAIILIAMYHFQIDLSDNMLSSLPTGSINIPTLTSLNLAYNKLVRIITIVIITNASSSLNLAYNKMVGSNITKVTIIIVIITNMPSNLNLAYNKLVGSNIIMVTIININMPTLSSLNLTHVKSFFKLLFVRLSRHQQQFHCHICDPWPSLAI